MPVYEYRCRCGERFDRFEPLSAAAGPIDCPSCGATEARRVPSPFARLGLADPGPDRSAWPRTWEAVGHGDRETIARWQRLVERRLDLERRHPELAPPPAKPVASHEHHHPHGSAPVASEPDRAERAKRGPGVASADNGRPGRER
ncbi:MAG TPA: zinc ribbon domain-containing protein [Candidatus Binatia bacterium]|nr:zinc ribbon domain-containing protein [Candidatus Binatia bacterium]